MIKLFWFNPLTSFSFFYAGKSPLSKIRDFPTTLIILIPIHVLKFMKSCSPGPTASDGLHFCGTRKCTLDFFVPFHFTYWSKSFSHSSQFFICVAILSLSSLYLSFFNFFEKNMYRHMKINKPYVHFIIKNIFNRK